MTTAPVTTNADGSAVCAHRDLFVCPACAADPRYVEVAGIHYWVPDADERAELVAALADDQPTTDDLLSGDAVTACCGAFVTFHDETLCCKGCWAALA